MSTTATPEFSSVVASNIRLLKAIRLEVAWLRNLTYQHRLNEGLAADLRGRAADLQQMLHEDAEEA